MHPGPKGPGFTATKRDKMTTTFPKKIDINFLYVVEHFPEAIDYLNRMFKHSNKKIDLTQASFTLQWLKLPQNKILWYIESEIDDSKQCWVPCLPTENYIPDEIMYVLER